MNLLFLAPLIDTGGVGARLARAFRRWRPGWNVTAVAGKQGPFRYPQDRLWHEVDVADLYARADVVQFQNTAHPYLELDEGRHPYVELDGDLRKPLVIAQQGTFQRDHAVIVNAIARALNATTTVSTIDLLADAGPDATWAPHQYDLDYLWKLREAHRGSRRRTRVALSPSVRRVKSTDYVLAILNRLASRHEIEVDLIEHQPWEQAMARKAQADLVVDQLVLGYGLNAIESWGMGIPVVVGFTDPDDVARGRAIWGELPFVNTTFDNLEERLDLLLGSAAERELAAERGRAHVRRWHDERTVVELMATVFEEAASRPSSGASFMRGWQRPADEPVNSIVPPPVTNDEPGSAPAGSFPIQTARRGRAGYRGEVESHLAAWPRLRLAR